MHARRCVFGSVAGHAQRRVASLPVARRGFLTCSAPELQPASGGRKSVQDVCRREIQTSSSWCAPWKVGSPQPPSIHPHSSTDCSERSITMPEQLRALMRLVTHSVVICTSTSPGLPPTPRAMTMSSFTSLSLNPSPTVSLNIASPSRTLDAVSVSRQFNVHIMTGDVAGARVADWFTRGNAEGARAFETERLWEGCGCSVATSTDETQPPVLVGKGILYALRCRLLDEPSGGLVKVRDHFIVLGEVLDIVEGEGTSMSDGEEKFGLIYADRTYRQLGNTMIKVDEDASKSV